MFPLIRETGAKSHIFRLRIQQFQIEVEKFLLLKSLQFPILGFEALSAFNGEITRLLDSNVDNDKNMELELIWSLNHNLTECSRSWFQWK